MLDNPVPLWITIITGLLAPFFLKYGKEFFDWVRGLRNDIAADHKQVTERRRQIATDELGRIIEAMKETIDILKSQCSSANLERDQYRNEVKACQGEKAEFAKQIGEKSVALAEAVAAKALALSEKAEVELQYELQTQALSKNQARVQELETQLSGAKELAKNLTSSVVTTTTTTGPTAS